MHLFVGRLPSVLAVLGLAIPCSISACSSSPPNSEPPPGGGDDAGNEASVGEAGNEGGSSSGGDGGSGGATCAAGSKTGAKGSTDRLATAGGLHFNVRVPPNYDPTVGHPLLVFYAEYGTVPPDMATFEEMDTGLTPVAYSHGYIMAYTDTPDTHNGIEDADTVPDVISKKWCVDPKRMYATGNSDGGTMTFELAVNFSNYAAVAPSAAGADSPTIAMTPCPEAQMPTHTTASAFVMHSTMDGTFVVQWGRDQAKWFAKCAGCSATPTLADSNGCVQYPSCSGGRNVLYCEGSQLHATWPGNATCPGPNSDCLNEPLLKFFDAHHL